MKTKLLVSSMLLGLGLHQAAPAVADDAVEMVTTTPVLVDGVLFTASFSRPEHGGHLRALDLIDGSPLPLWDAAERMPAAGTAAAPGDLATSDPPQRVDPDNLFRYLFTNLPEHRSSATEPFTAPAAARLLPALQVPGLNAAIALINRVRGRTDATPDCVDGSGEAAARLWGISRSSPAAVGRSPRLASSGTRPLVIYVGAEDGQLHAFHAGDWDAGANRHDPAVAAAGRELWAYLPGLLLPGLAAQPFEPPDDEFAVHVDGSPAVGDLHADWDRDGLREWRSLLVGTGTLAAAATGVAFGLDVTDPLQPTLLWENHLPGENAGRTRGAVLGSIDALPARAAAFLTSNLATPVDGSGQPDPRSPGYGPRAAALDPLSGGLLWEWQTPYPPAAAAINAVPAVPALFDGDGDTLIDAIVFGDMSGRLWVLDAATGRPRGGAPAFQVPGTSSQPIGAGVALHGRLAIFGTGGASHADADNSYAIYAVEILPSGAQLRWTYPLEPGEQVWSAPVIDRQGRIYFAAAEGYRPDLPANGGGSSGRLVVLDGSGRELASTPTDSAIAGRVLVGSGTALAVTLAGKVYQFGSVRRETGPGADDSAALQLFSWRVR